MSTEAEGTPPVSAAWVTVGLEAVIAHHKRQRDTYWTCPSSGEIGAAIAAVVPLAGAAERERAERAEAVLAGVREVIGTYFTVHGNNTAASLAKARDLAEGIRQVLDRVPLGGEAQERSDGTGGGRG